MGPGRGRGDRNSKGCREERRALPPSRSGRARNRNRFPRGTFCQINLLLGSPSSPTLQSSSSCHSRRPLCFARVASSFRLFTNGSPKGQKSYFSGKYFLSISSRKLCLCSSASCEIKKGGGVISTLVRGALSPTLPPLSRRSKTYLLRVVVAPVLPRRLDVPALIIHGTFFGV